PLWRPCAKRSALRETAPNRAALAFLALLFADFGIRFPKLASLWASVNHNHCEFPFFAVANSIETCIFDSDFPVAAPVRSRVAARWSYCRSNSRRLRASGLACVRRARRLADADGALLLPRRRPRLRAARLLAAPGNRTYLRDLTIARRLARRSLWRRYAAPG